MVALAERKIFAVKEEPATYYGIPILKLRVGDPLPTPTSPTRYICRVTADLARYLLTFNIDNNRRPRTRKQMQMASDMVSGLWQITPQCPYFNIAGQLVNGQNTMYAIIEAAGMKPGFSQWLVLDFGWQVGMEQVIDRNTPRNGSDTLRIAGISYPTLKSAMASRVWQLDLVMGTTRSLGGFPTPSDPQKLVIIRADEEAYDHSAHVGARIYDRLNKGGSPTAWGAFHYIAARDDSLARADAFMDEVAEGTGAANSPTRKLADWFRRRPINATNTGDSREPSELMIRAYNAHHGGKAFAQVKQKGFVLSRLRVSR
jgi:hypothetical protein